MRRAATFALLTVFCLAGARSARADHAEAPQIRSQIESWAALLDSHTRRFYYEVRHYIEDEDDQLVAEAKDLWRSARRLNDYAMDRASSERLEREVRQVESAYDRVREEFRDYRGRRSPVASASKRLERIDQLIHSTHDRVHDLVARDVQGAPSSSRPQASVLRNPPSEPVLPLEVERRPVEYVNPPAVRVGPDGFYFDGRRFTIPLGR